MIAVAKVAFVKAVGSLTASPIRSSAKTVTRILAEVVGVFGRDFDPRRHPVVKRGGVEVADKELPGDHRLRDDGGRSEQARFNVSARADP